MGGSPRASSTASGRGNQPAGQTQNIRFVTRNFAIILTDAVMMFAAADPQERRDSGDNVIGENFHVDHSKYSSCNKERFTRKEAIS